MEFFVCHHMRFVVSQENDSGQWEWRHIGAKGRVDPYPCGAYDSIHRVEIDESQVAASMTMANMVKSET